MRTYEEDYEHARDKAAFSSGTEWEIWSASWCERCANDPPDAAEGEGCPLILVALLQRTPSEWLEQSDSGSRSDRYHCVEFRPRDDGGGSEPSDGPIPGQGELIPPEPYVGRRMFADVVAELDRPAATRSGGEPRLVPDATYRTARKPGRVTAVIGGFRPGRGTSTTGAAAATRVTAAGGVSPVATLPSPLATASHQQLESRR